MRGLGVATTLNFDYCGFHAINHRTSNFQPVTLLTTFMIEPDLLYTVLCDEVRREDNGKWILLGLFERFTVAELPAQPPACCIVNKWCNGQGHHTQQTRFVDADDTILLQSDAIAFELTELEAAFTAVQMFSGLYLESEGRIWVEILLNGELKQRYPLRVQVKRRVNS